MAADRPRTELEEFCERCAADTTHQVRLEIRTENAASAFSREPYRVRTCRRCEATTATRMNDV